MVPKLLDFGLVRLLDSGRAVRSSSGILTGADTDPAPIIGGSLTKSGRLAGTPLYMSPEAHRGMRPDASFDLWGLAVVLYEAIAGVHPFKGTDIASTIDTIREASAADIRCHAPNCPAPIAEFLTASLHRDRARRPSSARGMREALELLEGVGGAWGGARDSVSP
jgi:serine/threonine protein kinase